MGLAWVTGGAASATMWRGCRTPVNVEAIKNTLKTDTGGSMVEQRVSITRQSDRWAWLWFVIGTVLSLFSTGQWAIPLVAWVQPIFFIRFVRTQRWWLGFLLVWLATFVTGCIGWWNILGYGVPTPIFIMTIAVNTLLIAGVAYLADRLLSPRLGGFAATLIFPLATTALDFLGMTMNPLGSFGAQAYTQYGSLPFMQLLSVTGMWGITFLVNWFAPVVNYAWERSFSWPQIRRGLAIFAAVMLVVLAYGDVRLAFFRPEAGTVRVAGLTAVDFRTEQDVLFQTRGTDWQAFRQLAAERYDPYFHATTREAQAGAKIVVWPEAALQVAAEDEAALIARGQEVSRQEGIYLAMSWFKMYEDGRPSQIKLVITDPDGKMVLEHLKYGGAMLEGTDPGDAILRTVETPYGTLSGLICWDTDFPTVVSQAGRNGTDILLSPSLEFRAADPMHAQMAVFRAIENGVSVVRQADNGLSIVADPYGRTLAAVDHFTASEWVMVAQVPTHGVFTVYSIVGDLFGWLSVLGFLAMVVWGVVRWLRLRRALRTQS
jgi:apolipoprotein N-acyltransferase